MSDPPAKNDPLDEAFAAYLRSCDAGEMCSREEFLARFPEHAEELRQLIQAADMIGNVTLKPHVSGTRVVEETKTQNDSDKTASWDPATTLPMSNRTEGDHGPTLPYDLGDYTLLKVIGRGGMGVVYRAKQRELDREVAVKMIRSGILADDDEVRRFYTEAQAAARLHHPGIVSVYQFGRRAGHHFFSMEYVRGTDLQRQLSDSELDAHQAARYVRDVALAIDHAHQRGVLHRDLKPANVLIDEQDRIHVTDFGLAKHLDSDSSVTSSGAAVGTPHYMAPEQAGGHSDRASSKSDVYSLGAILFACLTGRPPIVADTVMQTLVKVVHQPAPSVRSLREDVPADLETIIAKCLEKNPNQRYQSAKQLADELDAFLEGRPIEARPRSRLVKSWHWFQGVPLVGALTGRRVLHSSDLHRRFQAAVLLLLLVTPIVGVGAMIAWQKSLDAMPAIVRIGGGVQEGLYDSIVRELEARIEQTYQVQCEVIQSHGSLENREHLLQGRVDIAPMQGTAIKGERIFLVAPLIHELLYVLARNDSNVDVFEDLRDRQVAVGPIGGGSWQASKLVLDSLEWGNRVEPTFCQWRELLSDDGPNLAMICVGRGSELISSLISSGRWKLVPIQDALSISSHHPSLDPLMIQAEENLGVREIPTIGTIAFLAAREDTPSELIQALLETLYQEPKLCENLLPRDLAGELRANSFHRAARSFFGLTE